MGLNVLHLAATLSPDHGGPSKAVPAMCAAIRDSGHRAEIVTTTWKGRMESSVACAGDGPPITYHEVSWPQSYGTSWSLAADVRSRISEFDVVHVHQVYFFHGLIARLNCTREGIPVVISPHGVFDPFHRNVRPLKKAIYTRFVERRNIAQASAFHYASLAERDHAADAGMPDRAFVIPLAVELAPTCDVGPLLRLHPNLAGKTLITFLGRITAKKRLDLVVDAFSKVAAANSQVHLVIAGPDREGMGASVRAQIESLGIGAQASYVGVVTGEVRDALLAGSRMMVLPSESESFGLSVVEALAAGVPVIVSEGVAVHNEVAAGKAGLVVDRDSEMLADAIRSLISEDTHRWMSANARSLVSSNFGMQQMADGLEDMYRTVIEERSRN